MDLRLTVTRPPAADPRRMTTIVRAFVVGEARRVRDEVRRATPVDLGTLRSSINYKTSLRGAGAVAVISSSARPEIVETVEGGRRAGAKMPPPGVLLGWMGRKGIPADREFLVRRGIARNGIPGRFMFRRAAERLESRKAALGRDLARRIARGV